MAFNELTTFIVSLLWFEVRRMNLDSELFSGLVVGSSCTSIFFNILSFFTLIFLGILTQWLINFQNYLASKNLIIFLPKVTISYNIIRLVKFSYVFVGNWKEVLMHKRVQHLYTIYKSCKGLKEIFSKTILETTLVIDQHPS